MNTNQLNQIEKLESENLKHSNKIKSLMEALAKSDKSYEDLQNRDKETIDKINNINYENREKERQKYQNIIEQKNEQINKFNLKEIEYQKNINNIKLFETEKIEYNKNLLKIINNIEEKIEYYLKICFISKDEINKNNDYLKSIINKYNFEKLNIKNLDNEEKEILNKIKNIKKFGNVLNEYDSITNTYIDSYQNFLNDIIFLQNKNTLFKFDKTSSLSNLLTEFIKNIKYQIDFYINIRILHEYIQIFKNLPNTINTNKKYIYSPEYVKYFNNYVPKIEKELAILTFNDINIHYLSLLPNLDKYIDSNKLKDMDYVINIIDTNYNKYILLSDLFKEFILKLSKENYKPLEYEFISKDLNLIISKINKEYMPKIEELFKQEEKYEEKLQENELKNNVFEYIQKYSNILIKIIEFYISKDDKYIIVKNLSVNNKNNDQLNILNNIKDKNKFFINDLNADNAKNDIQGFFIKCNNYLLTLLELLSNFYAFKYEKLETFNEKLINKNEELNQENDKLKIEINNLSKLTDNLDKLTIINKKLEDDKKELLSIKDSLSRQLNEAEMQINDTQLLDKKRKEIKNLEKDIKQISKDNEVIIKLIKQTLFDKFFLIFKNTIPNIDDSIDINDYIIQIYEIVNTEFNRLNLQNKTNNDLYKKELEKLNNKISKLNEEKEKITVEKNKALEEIKQLKEQIAMKNEENQKIINDKLKDLQNELESKKTEYNINLEKLKNNNWTVATALEARNKAIEESDNIKAVNNKILIRVKELETEIQTHLETIKNNLIDIEVLKIENESIKNIKLNNDELKTRIDALLNENKLYQNQINELKELQLMNNSDLETKYTKLTEKLNKEIYNINKQLTTYINELKLCQSNSNKLNTKILELENLKTKLWTENDSLSRKLKDCNIKNTNLEKQKEEIFKTIDKLQQSNTDQNNEISQLKNKILELEKELSNNKNDEKKLIDDLNNQTKTLSNELSSLNITNENNINKLKEIIKNNLNTVINLNIKNKQLQLQINELLEKNKSLLENKTKLESEILSNNKSHNDLLTELTQKYNNNLSELRQITETLSNKQEEISKLIQKDKQSDKEIKELKDEILSLQSMKISLNAEFEQIKLDKSNLLIEKDKLETELDNCKQQLKKNIQEYKSKHNNNLLSEIKELKYIQSNLEQLLNKKNIECKELESKLKLEIIKLTKENEILKTKIQKSGVLTELQTTSNNKIDEMTNELIKISTENKTLKDIITSLKKEMTDLSANNLNDLSKCQELKNKIENELNNKIKDLQSQISEITMMNNNDISHIEQINKLNNKIKELQKEIIEIKNQYDINIKNKNKEISDKDLEILDLQNKLKQLTENNLMSNEDSNGLTNKINELRQESDKLKVEFNDLIKNNSKVLESKDLEIKSLKQELNQYKEINNINQQDMSKDNKIDILNNKIKELNDLLLLSNSNLKKEQELNKELQKLVIINENKFNELTKKNDVNISIINDLQKEKINLNKLILNLQKEKDKLDNKLNIQQFQTINNSLSKQEKVTEINNNKEIFNKTITELETLNNKYKDSIENLKIELQKQKELNANQELQFEDKLTKLNETFTNKFNELKLEKDKLIEERDNNKILTNNFSLELNKLSKSCKEEKLKLQQIIKNLNTFDIKNNNNITLNKTILDLQKINDDYDKEIKELKEKIIGFELIKLTLNNKIKSLNDNISNLKNHNILSDNEIKKINQELNLIKGVLKDKEIIIQNLENSNTNKEKIQIELINAKQLITELEQKLVKCEQTKKSEFEKELDNVKNILNAKYDTLQNAYDLYKVTNNNKIDELQTLNKISIEEKGKLQKIIEELTLKYDNLNKIKQSLDNKLLINQVNNNNKNLSSQEVVMDINNKLNQCNDTMANLKDLNQSYEKQIKEFKEKLLGLEFYKLNLSNKIKKLNKTIEILNDKNKLTQQEKDDIFNNLTKEIESIQDVLNSKETEIKNIESENKENNLKNSEELNKLKLELQKSQQIIDLLNKQIISINEEKNNIELLHEEKTQKYLDNYENILNNIKSEKESLETNNIEIKTNYENKIKELTQSSIKEKQNLELMITELQERIDNLKNKKNNIKTINKTNIEEIINKYETQITQLKNINISYENEIKELKSKILGLQFYKLNLFNQIKKLKNSIDYIKNNNIQDQKDKDKLINELDKELLLMQDLLKDKEDEITQKSKDNLINNEELKSLKDELLKSTLLINKLNKEMLDLTNDNSKNKQLYEDTLNQITNKFENKIKQLESDILLLTNDNITLKDGNELQLNELNNKCTKEKNLLQDTISNLKVLKNNNIKNINLTDHINKLEQMNEKLNLNIIDLNKEIYNLRFNNSKLSNTIKLLNLQIIELNKIANTNKLSDNDIKEIKLKMENKINELNQVIKDKELELINKNLELEIQKNNNINKSELNKYIIKIKTLEQELVNCKSEIIKSEILVKKNTTTNNSLLKQIASLINENKQLKLNITQIKNSKNFPTLINPESQDNLVYKYINTTPENKQVNNIQLNNNSINIITPYDKYIKINNIK